MKKVVLIGIVFLCAVVGLSSCGKHCDVETNTDIGSLGIPYCQREGSLRLVAN